MSTPGEKIGVLLETCEPDLNELVPPDKLVSMLADEHGVLVLSAPCWSDETSVQRIRKACVENNLDGVVICGPSPESSQVSDWLEIQDRQEAVAVVHAAIHDHVSPDGKDDKKALEKIERLVRMAIARVRGSSPVRVMEKPVQRKVLVIGGTQAAFETSQRLAGSGLQVVMAESKPAPCVYPLNQDMVKELRSSKNVDIIEDGSIEYVDGAVGDFHVELSTASGRRYLEVGAIVVAVELETFESAKLPGVDSERVLSLRVFGQQLQDGGGTADSVCILLDRGENERICAAKAAVEFAYKHAKAGGKASIVARHMPVYGTQGQQIYDEARKAGVRFLRVAQEPSIEQGAGCISVKITDTVLPEKQLSLQVDRLVLPESMGPSKRLARLAHVLHQPRDLMGYLQSGNVRHRPVGSARLGVFFVGGCHDQCEPAQASVEARAVVGKILSQLPEKEVRVATEKIIYDTGHCARCLNCVRSCPHGAIHPDEEGHWVELLDAACWQCGICASVCPGLALEHARVRFDQMHHTLHVATADLAQSPPVVAFACRQGAIRAMDEARRQGLSLPQELLVVDVPCAGLVSDRILLDAIEQGARGVMVLGCHHDNCRSLWGSDLAGSRVEILRKKLAELGVEEQRICFHPVAANEAFRLIHLLGDAMGEFPEGRAFEPGPYRAVDGDEFGQEVIHG